MTVSRIASLRFERWTRPKSADFCYFCKNADQQSQVARISKSAHTYVCVCVCVFPSVERETRHGCVIFRRCYFSIISLLFRISAQKHRAAGRAAAVGHSRSLARLLIPSNSNRSPAVDSSDLRSRFVKRIQNKNESELASSIAHLGLAPFINYRAADGNSASAHPRRARLH